MELEQMIICLLADARAIQEEMETWMDAWLEGIMDGRGEMEACLERKKPTPEEMANAAAHPKAGATRAHKMGPL
jgi:hypothetical protein